MAKGVTKLSAGEKIGYSLGDGAANFIFQAIMMFQVVYFVDVLGLTSSQVAVMFIVVLFWNAIFDPIMGIIADKTRTRWGKFRPWILWSAVPFGICFFLTYFTPKGATLAYAYITYTLMMTVYSINNTPYSALGGVMTGDTEERTSIASYRQFTAMAAAFIFQGFFLSIVTHFAPGGNIKDPQGWRVAVGIFAGLAMIFHLITFLTTRERIIPEKQEEAKLKDALKDLVRNGPWVILFFATLLIFINLAMRGNMLYAYFTKYMDISSINEFLGNFGYDDVSEYIQKAVTEAKAAALDNNVEFTDDLLNKATADGEQKLAVKAFELFNMVGMAFTIIGITISKFLSVKFGKQKVFVFGLALATLFGGLFYIAENTQLWVAYGINICLTLSYGITIPLLWSMLGDVADFSVFKFKRRSTGIVFAGIGFALKVGLGVGGALAALVQGWYVIGTTKVPEIAGSVIKYNDVDVINTEGIRLGASIYPAILFGAAVIFLIFYSISTTKEKEIQDELEKRRQKA